MVQWHRDIIVGNKRRVLEIPGFRLIEASYPGHLVVPPHRHATTNITLILAGALEETVDGQSRQCGPGDVVIKPAGLTHSNAFSSIGARTLVVECINNQPHDLHSNCRAYRWLAGGMMTPCMVQLFSKFRSGEEATIPTVLNTLCHNLGIAGPEAQNHRRHEAPAWLSEVCAFIDQRLADSLQVNDVARAFEKHPVYLARVFRRFHGMSVTDYMRYRRSTRVASRLADGQSALTDIALSTGFADQAHMTRSFKSSMGVTPGVYRQLLQ